MPYEIRKTEGKKPWCVYKKDTGERVGCSKTKAEAEAFMRAKYAHSKDAKK